MRTKNKILYSGIILFILAILAIVFVDKSLFWRTQRNEIEEWAQHAAVVQSKNRPIVLFIGDSRIANFPLRLAFPQNFMIINKGIGGNSIKQISERYRSIIDKTPHDIVVVNGGINDILGCVINNKNEKIIVSNILYQYEKIISMSINNNKDVMIIEMIPVTNRFLFPFMRAVSLPTRFDVKKTNRIVVKVNDQLKKLCLKTGSSFIETHNVLAHSNGEFIRDFSAADGYHLNITGYKVLSSVIEPYLIQMKMK